MPSRPFIVSPTLLSLRLGSCRFVLAQGSNVIGRDAAAQLAIPDTAVSRQHARIQVDVRDNATIEDLQSCNGTLLNGIPISGPRSLREGDIIGISTYEFAFGTAAPLGEGARISVPVRVCPSCHVVCSADRPVCVRCGRTTTLPSFEGPRIEQTLPARWSLGMLLEMLGKSMLADNSLDADRLMAEVALIVADRARDNIPLEPEELKALAEAARWLAKAQTSDNWLAWFARIAGGPPSAPSPQAE